jgi:hypothetical protein
MTHRSTGRSMLRMARMLPLPTTAAAVICRPGSHG